MTTDPNRSSDPMPPSEPPPSTPPPVGGSDPYASAPSPGDSDPYASAPSPGDSDPHASAPSPGDSDPYASAPSPGDSDPYASAPSPGDSDPYASAPSPGDSDPYATPPAAGSTPPPPAAGSGFTHSTSDKPATSMSLDRSKLSMHDQGLVAAAVLFFIALLLPWGSISINAAGLPGADGSESSNGFSSSLLTLAWILLVAAAVLALLPAMGMNLKLPFPRSLVLLGLTGLAALITLFGFIDALTAPDDVGQAEALGLDVSYSAGIGAYLGMLIALGAVALAFLAYRSDQSGRSVTA